MRLIFLLFAWFFTRCFRWLFSYYAFPNLHIIYFPCSTFQRGPLLSPKHLSVHPAFLPFWPMVPYSSHFHNSWFHSLSRDLLSVPCPCLSTTHFLPLHLLTFGPLYYWAWHHANKHHSFHLEAAPSTVIYHYCPHLHSVSCSNDWVSNGTIDQPRNASKKDPKRLDQRPDLIANGREERQKGVAGTREQQANNVLMEKWGNFVVRPFLAYRVPLQV